MIKKENECVGCPPEMGCLGSSCPNRNVIRIYCDKCGDEGKIYRYDGEHLCINCIEATLKEVGADDL